LNNIFVVKKILSDFLSLIFQKENNTDYSWTEIVFVTAFLIFIISALLLAL